MYAQFFVTAAVSPSRQRGVRGVMVGHLVLLLVCAWWGGLHRSLAGQVLGQVLLTAGIVEGAVLAGWRMLLDARTALLRLERARKQGKRG